MREIKFRAWDKDTNKFLDLDWDGYYIDMSTGEVYEIEERSEHYQTYMYKRYLSQVEVMQYTGLKDRNGVEIYEGDILQSNLALKQLGKVIYDQGCFRVLWEKSSAFPDGYDSYLVQVCNGCVVNGNIYENPELV